MSIEVFEQVVEIGDVDEAKTELWSLPDLTVDQPTQFYNVITLVVGLERKSIWIWLEKDLLEQNYYLFRRLRKT